MARTLSPNIHVFCYHGVADRISDPVLERHFMPVRGFREQIAYFQKYSIISLSQLEDALMVPEPEEPLIVITIDDAYGSTLQMHEILAERGVPWALFVPTGVIGPRQVLWTAELALLILHGSCAKVELLGGEWFLASRLQREGAYDVMRRRIKQLRRSEKDCCLAELREQYLPGETKHLQEEFPLFRVMSWDEIGNLHQAGVTIGSHGVTHEGHHAGQDAFVRCEELEQSKSEIDLRLGGDCRYFAFPSGRFHSGSPAELAAAGYTLGFATGERALGLNENPYLLPRLNPRLWQG